ncbi:unnamed protein product [Mytilus coruscus]|uniref:Uncharacterized protein n=1 Tax=Mytilus coruscus TaxID=42192 RepID=A0A6J8AZL0_MYTCO|nr:unnamed protein product [Mytilus coruscus]
MDTNLNPFQKRILLGRGIASLILDIMTMILLAISNISIGIIYKNPLTSDNEACAIKSGYGLFIVATAIELVLLVMESIALCMMNVPQAPDCCRCERYHLRFILHFTASASIVIGAIIYGVEDSSMVGWSFWVALSASILAMINGIIWCLTMQMARLITKGGDSSTTAGWGLNEHTGTGNVLGGSQPLGGDFGGGLGSSGLSNDLGNVPMGEDLGSVGLDAGTVALDGNLGSLDVSGGLDKTDLIGGDLIGGNLVGLNDGKLENMDLIDNVTNDLVLQEELKTAPKELDNGVDAFTDNISKAGTSIDLGAQLPQSIGLNGELG